MSFHNFGYKVIQLKEVTENKAMREEEGGGGVQCMTGGEGASRRVRLLLFDGCGGGGRGSRVRLTHKLDDCSKRRERRKRSLTFFCGQGVLLLRLCLLQLGLVEAGHLRDVGLVVAHGCGSGGEAQM